MICTRFTVHQSIQVIRKDGWFLSIIFSISSSFSHSLSLFFFTCDLGDIDLINLLCFGLTSYSGTCFIVFFVRTSSCCKFNRLFLISWRQSSWRKCVWFFFSFLDIFFMSSFCFLSITLPSLFSSFPPLSSLRRWKDPPHGLVDLSLYLQHYIGCNYCLLLLQVTTPNHGQLHTLLRTLLLNICCFLLKYDGSFLRMCAEWCCSAGINVRSLVLGTVLVWSRTRPTSPLENPWRTW